MTLAELLAKLEKARTCAEVFGDFTGSAAEQLIGLRDKFRELAKKLHPVGAGVDDNDPVAVRAFTLLVKFRDRAIIEIEDGTYGKIDPVEIKIGKKTYLVGGLIARGDFANVYNATLDDNPFVLKVARGTRDNDLMQNEAVVITALQKANRDNETKFDQLLPTLADSFTVNGCRANVFAHRALTPLSDIITAYPQGILAADMAWMFKRLLSVLGFIHHAGYIHGAVLPTHCLMSLEDHGMVLCDYTSTIKLGRHVPCYSLPYEEYYAPEIMAKKQAFSGSDILMAARTMIRLLGGNPITGEIPDRVPRSIRNFLLGCLIINPSRRPFDAWDLHSKFDEILKVLYGRPKFRPFTMPQAQPTCDVKNAG